MRAIIASVVLSTCTLTMPLHASAEDGLVSLLRFAAGFLNEGVFPVSDAYTTDDDVVIVAHDGVELAANVFVPTALHGPAPAVVFVNSWGLNEYQYLEQAADLAEQGYIVLSYSTRGFGSSGGLIDVAGPNDMDDFSAVIDHLVANYPVDPSAIGAGGISYGAGISLLGAALDGRVAAVASMSGWADLVDALYGNNTPRVVWGELLTLTAELTGNPDPIIAEHWDTVLRQDLDAIPEVLDWAAIRSPGNYVDALNATGTAVYLAKAYGDNLFQPNTLLDMFGELTTPKHIDVVPGTHATAEILPSLLGIGDNVIWENVYQWFDIHLKGETNDLAAADPVNMKVKFEDRFEGFAGYPVAAATERVLHLHPRRPFDDGHLETYPYRSWFNVDNTINAWAGTILSTAIPLLSQLLEQLEIPILTNVYSASEIRSIYFKTDRLERDMRIRGTPSVSVRVQPKYSKAQLVAYLYDMDAFGTGRLITHGAITLPSANWGETTTLEFDLVTTAYDIPAGRRLVVAFDTKDPQYKSPTSAPYEIDFEFGRGQESTLTIPVL